MLEKINSYRVTFKNSDDIIVGGTSCLEVLKRLNEDTKHGLYKCEVTSISIVSSRLFV